MAEAIDRGKQVTANDASADGDAHARDEEPDKIARVIDLRTGEARDSGTPTEATGRRRENGHDVDERAETTTDPWAEPLRIAGDAAGDAAHRAASAAERILETAGQVASQVTETAGAVGERLRE